MTTNVLKQMIFAGLPGNREQHLVELWETTKATLVVGYAYKISCLHATGYQSYGSWLHHDQPQLSVQERNKMCEKVTQITTIHTRYEYI